MFNGHSKHNIDDKGRLHLPSKFRSSLGEIVFITLGMGKKLEIFTADQFKVRSEFLDSMPFGKKEVRQFKEAFHGYTFEVPLDKSGRINLPKELLSFANITKEVVVSGNGKSLLLWSEKEFDAFSNEALPKLEELADKIADLDF